jgi:hypothetical protein
VIHAKVAKFAALLLVATISLTARDAAAQFLPNQSQSAAFTGPWCAQGDPTKTRLDQQQRGISYLNQ